MAQAATSKNTAKKASIPPQIAAKSAKKTAQAAKPVKKTAKPVLQAADAGGGVDLVPLPPSAQAMLRLGVLVKSMLKNVRKKPTTGFSVRQLADQIKAHTLLQNLVVFAQFKNGRFTGFYEVSAGGRRLEALWLLRDVDQLFTNDELIAVKIITEEEAISASLSENVGREAMHPADEFTAFQAMREQGYAVDEIAGRFGVETIEVERRLKLVNVSPVLFDLYRDDQMKLEVLMAFTLTDDHARQLAVWEGMHPHYRQFANSVRNALLDGKFSLSDNKLAKFVGAEAYQAAGGFVLRDLFDSNNTGYVADAALLHKLATAKLEAQQDEVENEGWSWVKIEPDCTHATLNAYTTAQPRKRKKTPEEADALADLESRRKALAEQMDAYYDLDESTDEDDEKHEVVSEEYEAVGVLIEQEKAKLDVWSAAIKKSAGAIVAIGSDGKAEIHRGLIRKEDRKAAIKAAAEGEKAGEGSDLEAGEPEQAKLSDALHRRLTAQHTAALQLAVARNTQAALVALADNMVRQLLRDAHSYFDPGSTALTLRMSPVVGELRTADTSIEQAPAAQAFDTLRTSWLARIPKEDVLTWLDDLAQSDLLDLIAFCTALTINVVRDREVHRAAGPLSAATNLDMADWWSPTADNYLGSVPKVMISQAVKESGVDASLPELEKLKKGDMAAQAEHLLQGKRWLPGVLRTPTMEE